MDAGLRVGLAGCLQGLGAGDGDIGFDAFRVEGQGRGGLAGNGGDNGFALQGKLNRAGDRGGNDHQCRQPEANKNG